MRTETTVINEDICCWVYTINPSEHHRAVAMRVRYGTPAMCVAMAPPERRECVLKSSGANPILAAPTRLHSALMTEMMFEVLTKQRP